MKERCVRLAGSTGPATLSSVALVIELGHFGKTFGLHQGHLEDSRRPKLFNFLAQDRHLIMLIILRWVVRLYWCFEDSSSMKTLALIAI